MWRGFVAESKSYMNYPKCGRVKFWLAFPVALARYTWYVIVDRARLWKSRCQAGNTQHAK